MLGLFVGAVIAGTGEPTVVSGGQITLRLSRSSGEVVEEFYVRDRAGHEHLTLVSPKREGLALPAGESTSTLYPAVPSLGFTDYRVDKKPNGELVTLSRHDEGGDFTKTVLVPVTGRVIDVQLTVHLASKDPTLKCLLLSYAFLPDGKPLSAGKPDSTFLPGLRPDDNNVVGDHVFRSPVAMAQKGPLAALLIPDLNVLKDNHPMDTVLDLDCKNGVVDAPLLSYGFCAYQVSKHVYYVTDFEKPRPVPRDLRLGMQILLNADAPPFAGYQEADTFLWDHYGKKYFDKVLPQALPFEEYAKYCYPAAFSEVQGTNPMGWFERDIDGHPCGGVISGWGAERGWISWQDWFNNLRSAYGLRVWGQRLDKKDWVDKADKMLNLALAAPLVQGACPTTYATRRNLWIGSLIRPDSPVGTPIFDLTNMAWKGIWLLRWAIYFPDCPRRAEILRQCREMADCMMRFQNKDGSIPSWLTEDLKVVPVLDDSAQTALPAWFLFRLSKVPDDQPAGFNERAKSAALQAADFLTSNVVDGQYYYDFETFFSCSAKTCLQVNGTSDNEAMRDPHTLQPPQNTLSMQWTAEALREAYHATGKKAYLDKALMALDKMDLYQIVWPISYRHTAYVYGGFGVQNSDGEYDDARQAQFGETLCDFGADLGRQDLFERGVAAVRASLALVNHPLHAQYGIYPNPNCPPGLEPENCCHGGTDTQSGRTGFDWGEGSGLTSMAVLLQNYGDAFIDRSAKWEVGINGLVPDGHGFARSLLWDVQQKTTQGPMIDVVDETGKRSKMQASLIAADVPQSIH